MRCRLADLILDSSEPLPELAEADGSPEVTVAFRDTIAIEGARWFHAWPTPEGDDWVRFGRVGGTYVLEFPNRARVRLSNDASSVELAPLASTPPDTLRHLLLHQVLPLVLSRRGRVVVHASAVSVDGGVTAFVGPTDAGKSTLAAACCIAGAAHVTDDALVLVASADEASWRVVPSYAGLRLWCSSTELLGWPLPGTPVPAHRPKLRFGPENCAIAFEDKSLPLTRVVVLERARRAESRTQLLSGHRAVLSIATHLFRLDIEDAGETVRLFDALARITPGVEVLHFETDVPTEAAALALPKLFPPRG